VSFASEHSPLLSGAPPREASFAAASAREAEDASLLRRPPAAAAGRIAMRER